MLTIQKEEKVRDGVPVPGTEQITIKHRRDFETHILILSKSEAKELLSKLTEALK